MSWSFSAQGTPDEVEAAIENSSNNQLTEQSLAEWQEAKPALLTLVHANKTHRITLDANGHATFTNGEKTYGQCHVTLTGAPKAEG